MRLQLLHKVKNVERILISLFVLLCGTTLYAIFHLPTTTSIYSISLSNSTNFHFLYDKTISSSIINNETNNINNDPICSNYSGILLIQKGDQGAAAGTIFFQYVINQLIYANKYNLLPIVHLNNQSKHVYDPIVHGKSSQIQTITGLHGMTIPWIANEPDDHYYNNLNITTTINRSMKQHNKAKDFGIGSFPGRPIQLYPNLTIQTITLHGTGVWQHYFLPVVDYISNNNNNHHNNSSGLYCPNLPILTMHYYHLNPGLLFYCPWSVKSWPYTYLPQRLQIQPNHKQSNRKRNRVQDYRPKTVSEWYEPMRQQANSILINEYNIQFQPHIVAKANELMPPMYHSNCLSIHIRHSDKGGTNRKRIAVQDFYPYVQAFVNGGGQAIYLATDSSSVMTEINTTWNSKIVSMIHTQGDDILRSSSKKAVFVMEESNHHRTNTEVLIDILALSFCPWFIHGFSAVSEAALYLNYNHISTFVNSSMRSINLEQHPNHVPQTPSDFEVVVKQIISQQQQQ